MTQKLMINREFPPPPPALAVKTTDGSSDDDGCAEYEMLKTWAMVTAETMEQRLERYIEYFTPNLAHYRTMVAAFEHEMQIGLEAHLASPDVWKPSVCSFKMLDACIDRLPTGREKGVYYALDFGGTNFRVVRTELKGNGKLSFSQYKRSLMSATSTANLPKGLLNSRATASQMFDFFSETCKDFMIKMEDLKPDVAQETEHQAGFTFSFPCTLKSINYAILMEWTKGFETGRATNDPAEGHDVVGMTNAAFERFKVPLKVAAVLNDTVGTLLSAAYEMNRDNHPPCLIGLILGTGINAAYFEKEALEYGYKGGIINLECGNFNRELPSTSVDFELDFAESANRGRQRLEKMMSGAYIGELSRRAIVKVLQHHAPSCAWKPNSLTCEHACTIMTDASSDYAITENLLSEIWNHSFPYAELCMIRRLCHAIMNRATALAAVVIAAVARKTKHLQPAMGGVSCAIDGSLYKCIPFFQRVIRTYLDAILGKSIASLIHLIPADDGSGKGSAICAATVSASQAAGGSRFFR